MKVEGRIAEDAANYPSEIERLGGGLCLSVSPDYTAGADSDAAARAKTRSGVFERDTLAQFSIVPESLVRIEERREDEGSYYFTASRLDIYNVAADIHPHERIVPSLSFETRRTFGIAISPRASLRENPRSGRNLGSPARSHTALARKKKKETARPTISINYRASAFA